MPAAPIHPDGDEDALSSPKPGIEVLIEAARRGRSVYDASFDQIYPPAIREFSPRHWTPIKAAVRALEMLEVDAKTRVLDVGSGAGKFCLVGALTTPGTFVGIEQRAPLVTVAREIARAHRVERVSYVEGAMEHMDWSPFNAFYFYNPFGEFLLDEEERITFEARFSADRHKHLLRVARAKLYLAPVGTRVVTFHGLGAPLPSGYRRVASEEVIDGTMESWVREDPEQETPGDCTDSVECRCICQCGGPCFSLR